MPTYDYECEKCNQTFEVFQKMTDEKLKECPTCGGSVTRLIGTGAGLVFKGSGFYETDFKKKKGEAPKETKTSVPKESAQSSSSVDLKNKTESSKIESPKTESSKGE